GQEARSARGGGSDRGRQAQFRVARAPDDLSGTDAGLGVAVRADSRQGSPREGLSRSRSQGRIASGISSEHQHGDADDRVRRLPQFRRPLRPRGPLRDGLTLDYRLSTFASRLLDSRLSTPDSRLRVTSPVTPAPYTRSSMNEHGQGSLQFVDNEWVTFPGGEL